MLSVSEEVDVQPDFALLVTEQLGPLAAERAAEDCAACDQLRHPVGALGVRSMA